MEYTITALSLQMGENELERRVVWYQPKAFSSASVQIALLEEYEKDGGFTAENSTLIPASVSEIYMNDKFVSCKARIHSLEAGKQYIYRVGHGEGYDSEAYVFRTEENACREQDLFLVGDMHINVYKRSPAFDTTYINGRWQHLLSRATSFNGKHSPSFLLSVGDNISVCNMADFAYPEKKNPQGVQEYAEAEATEFFAPREMKEIAFASVLGNHDCLMLGKDADLGLSSICKYHYDLPGDDGYSGHYLDNSSGNFFFKSGELLVVGITEPDEFAQNNAEPCSTEVNRAFIEKAIASHPVAKWRILINHVPAFSYIAYYAPSGEEKPVENFSRLTDGFDFDVFFTGHQHAFSRTHAMSGSDVVGAEVVENRTDKNGYKVETLTRPRGVIHYNIPSAHDHAFYQRPYRDKPEKLFGAYGITPAALEDMKKKHPDEAAKFNGILYSSPMYTYVSMCEGEMRIMTVRSDKNIPVDTLIIKK